MLRIAAYPIEEAAAGKRNTDEELLERMLERFPSDPEAYADEQKWRYLGEGSFAVAYLHPQDSRKVVRISKGPDACYAKYMSYAKNNKSKALPKVHADMRWGPRKSGTLTVVEHLHAVNHEYGYSPFVVALMAAYMMHRGRKGYSSEGYKWEAMVEDFVLSTDDGRDKKWTKFLDSNRTVAAWYNVAAPELAMRGHVSESEALWAPDGKKVMEALLKAPVPEMKLLADLRRKTRCKLDPHPNNIMFRRNGDMVFNDPIYRPSGSR